MSKCFVYQWINEEHQPSKVDVLLSEHGVTVADSASIVGKIKTER